MVKIFIDPGHGGDDPGAVGNGLQEKDITLAISLKLRNLLKAMYRVHTIKLSRTTDVKRSLQERTAMAHKWGADYLISIHVNAGGGTGFESFTYNGNYGGKKRTNQHGLVLHQCIVNETGFINRGRKEANFHMLRESSMPAILTENGFIDRQEDARKLKNEAFLSKIAYGHAKGLAKIFDIQENNQSKATFYTIQKGDTFWGLARKYGTTVATLKTLNMGIIPERLQIGQKVRVK